MEESYKNSYEIPLSEVKLFFSACLVKTLRGMNIDTLEPSTLYL